MNETTASDLIALTRTLIAEIRSTDITEAEWSTGKFRVKIERQTSGSIAADTIGHATVAPDSARDHAVVPSSDRTMVRAPIHGIFYAAAEETAPAFAVVGTAVTTGQTLCVIEAMKVFTNVPSPCDGTIVGIGPSNGQEIAPGDLLFEIAAFVNGANHG